MKLAATLFSKRQTDQAAAVHGHEIDDLRGHFLSRADEIAFVFAVFVINDDDNFAVANVTNGVVN